MEAEIAATEENEGTRPGEPLSPTGVLVLSITTGLGAANLFYNQPMLGVIGRSFHSSSHVHLIPTITLLGYAAGLLLLVPLGDLFERRRLILAQFLALAVALCGAALAPSGFALLVASLIIGAAASVAQQIVPMAAALASPERRGAVVGTVMSGLFCGVLLSRTLSGFVTARLGWRAMFWIAAPLALLGALSTRLMPTIRPSVSMGYGALMASVGRLWMEEPRLRRATLTQGCLFAAFNCFWTVLALRLEGPPFFRGAAMAGLFGLIGTVGVLVAPLAGRQADHRGSRPVVALGVGSALAAWLLFLGWNTMAGMVLGLIILDFGAQSALIAHQQLVYGVRPEARNRLNTLFMVGMFLAGGLGSGGAMLAWRQAGWTAVCGLAILFCVLAGLLTLSRRTSSGPGTRHQSS